MPNSLKGHHQSHFWGQGPVVVGLESCPCPMVQWQAEDDGCEQWPAVVIQNSADLWEIARRELEPAVADLESCSCVRWCGGKQRTAVASSGWRQ